MIPMKPKKACRSKARVRNREWHRMMRGGMKVKTFGCNMHSATVRGLLKGIEYVTIAKPLRRGLPHVTFTRFGEAQ